MSKVGFRKETFSNPLVIGKLLAIIRRDGVGQLHQRGKQLDHGTRKSFYRLAFVLYKRAKRDLHSVRETRTPRRSLPRIGSTSQSPRRLRGSTIAGRSSMLTRLES